MSTSVSRCQGLPKNSNSCVRPGVLEVRAKARRPVSALIKDDLPTLERPAKAISIPVDGSSASNEPAAPRSPPPPPTKRPPPPPAAGGKNTGQGFFRPRAPPFGLVQLKKTRGSHSP